MQYIYENLSVKTGDYFTITDYFLPLKKDFINIKIFKKG